MVSVSNTGESANNGAWPIGISADGQHVLFASRATNLVEGADGEPGRPYNLYIRDRSSGITEWVTMAHDGSGPDSSIGAGSISADGRYVIFSSRATNIVPGDTNAAGDIFVHDRHTRLTERVSLGSEGGQLDVDVSAPAMSADGRYIAFVTTAAIVEGDTNGLEDVVVVDRTTGMLELISVGSDGAQSNDFSSGPSLSADGRYVAFQSWATNLVPDDENGVQDIFVRDRVGGHTELVSISTGGRHSNGWSERPLMSADGAAVAFVSLASNLVPSDFKECPWPNYNVNCGDVFIRDLEALTTERISVTSDGDEADRESWTVTGIGSGGRWVTFASDADNLDPDRIPPVFPRFDAYVRDRFTGVTERISIGDDGSQGQGHSVGPIITPDGRYVAFGSDAANLVADDDLHVDVFLRDRGPETGVGGLEARPTGDRIVVKGWARMAPALLASKADPSSDAGPGGSETGVELTGASVMFRPELQDLFIRLDVVDMPTLHPERPVSGIGVLPGAGLTPGILWGMRFELDGVPHEVRASRDTDQTFQLYRCPGEICEKVADLTGGVGTIGEAVVVGLPLDTLSAVSGSELSGIRAFSGPGDIDSGSIRDLDTISLPDADIPFAGVELGVAEADTPPDEITFDIEAAATHGMFSTLLEAGDLSPGAHDVWARTCVGGSCGKQVVRVDR